MTETAYEEQATEGGVEKLLRINFACNQNCAFCFVKMTGRRVALERIERFLAAASRSGGLRGLLTISGGEPTADTRLCGILRSARAKGLRRVRIQTNAVPLADPAPESCTV